MEIPEVDLIRQHGYTGRITVTIDNKVAVLKMGLDQNRINAHFVNEFNRALDQVLTYPNVKVLVITGNGKFFCYGLDLDWLSHMSVKVTGFPLKFRNELLGPLWKRIMTFPMATIGAINGHAFGGGAMLALLMDYRTMGSNKGWFSLNEVKLGIRFQPYTRHMVLKYRLPRGGTAHQAAVLGFKYTGTEALEAGIVQHVITNQDLFDSTRDMAQSLVEKTGTITRESMANMKHDLYLKDFETKLESNL